MKRAFLSLFVFLSLALSTALFAESKASGISAQLEVWDIDIDFYPGSGQESDGDSTLIGPRVDVPLCELYSIDLLYMTGREDYGDPHTDVHHARATFFRDLGGFELGLGWSYWDNLYSNDDSNLEQGPTVVLRGGSDQLIGYGWTVSGEAIWKPVDLGEEGDYEYLSLDAGVGRSLGPVDLHVGYRLKTYYDSPDDYRYSGLVGRVGLSF